MSQPDKPTIEASIDTSKVQPRYKKLYWLIYLLFPFMMQGFKTDEIAKNSPSFLSVEAQMIVDSSKAIDLEVSRTERTSNIGLGFREDKDLPNDRGLLYAGMLTNNTTFDGKNNKFATDLLFIQANTVVQIDRVDPCNEDKCLAHQTNKPFDRVIEVKAGIANKLNISVGKKLDIKFYPRR